VARFGRDTAAEDKDDQEDLVLLFRYGQMSSLCRTLVLQCSLVLGWLEGVLAVRGETGEGGKYALSFGLGLSLLICPPLDDLLDVSPGPGARSDKNQKNARNGPAGPVCC